MQQQPGDYQGLVLLHPDHGFGAPRDEGRNRESEQLHARAKSGCETSGFTTSSMSRLPTTVGMKTTEVPILLEHDRWC